MKKKLNGILALTLSVTMLAACAAGGGTTGESNTASTDGTQAQSSQAAQSDAASSAIDMNEEPYTVAIQVVMLPGTQTSGEEEREAAINAITLPAINTKVDIQEVWISEVANTTRMAIAGNEKMDLVHVATVQQLPTMVGADMLYDMNENNLLQTRGQKLIELFGDLIKTGEVGGKQLAVPAKTFNAAGVGFAYNKDLADAAGVSFGETATFEEFNEALYKVAEANPDAYAYYMGDGKLNALMFIRDYITFGTNFAYGGIMDADKELKVENIYESEDFKNFCLTALDWKLKGVQPGDPTDATSVQEYLSAGKAFCAAVLINEEQKAQWSQFGEFVNFVQLVEPKVSHSTVTEYMWGIASNSERPDKAMDFLNYMYTNEAIPNILKFGLEGTNYEFADGSTKVIVPNNTYAPSFFKAGDESKILIMSPASEDYVEKSIKMNKEAKVSSFIGYMFDDSAFQTESALINSTIQEYLPRLQNGMAGSEEATLALIDEFNAKLKSSGIDDVIAENQKQLDAFMSQK